MSSESPSPIIEGTVNSTEGNRSEPGVLLPTRRLIAHRCRGCNLELIQRWSEELEKDRERLATGQLAGEHLITAFGYVLGYPVFLGWIGHEWNKDQTRSRAYDRLNLVHIEAIRQLMKQTEQLKLDSRPIWEYGRICRELFANKPWEYYVGRNHSWPECLGPTRMELPHAYQIGITEGESLIMRLDVLPGVQDWDAKRRQLASPNQPRRRGRPCTPGFAPSDDLRIFEAWLAWRSQTGNDLIGFAKAQGKQPKLIRLAIDRHRKRSSASRESS